jgi:hypothetical protein
MGKLSGEEMWRGSDAPAPKDLIEGPNAALCAAKHRWRNAVVEHGHMRAGDTDGLAIRLTLESRWKILPRTL